jgi:hypothetical protein
MRRLGALLFAVAVLGGCYHATIETGLAPGSTTIQEDWAMSFVYGLVPPPTMDAMGQCPSGVAQVETQHSFLNGLVAAISFGIVTPITITVTCAGEQQQDVELVDTREGLAEALTKSDSFLVDLRK